MTDDTDCIFCAIVGGRAEAHVVHEDALSMAILDIQPLARGHCLVIPRRHVPWWHDLTSEETASLFEVARVVSAKLKAAFDPDFVCLYARGRRVPHTHVFLVPTYAGDPLDRHFNALEGFQESAEDLAAWKSRQHLADAAELLRRT